MEHIKASRVEAKDLLKTMKCMVRIFIIDFVTCIPVFALSGCFPTLTQEEFVRVAAAHSLNHAKWPFGGSPQFFKLGTESVCFHFETQGALGIERLLAL